MTDNSMWVCVSKESGDSSPKNENYVIIYPQVILNLYNFLQFNTIIKKRKKVTKVQNNTELKVQ